MWPTYLNSQSSHSTEKYRGLGHLMHSNVSQHISLAAVHKNEERTTRQRIVFEYPIIAFRTSQRESKEGTIDDTVKVVHLPVKRIIYLHRFCSHAGRGGGENPCCLWDNKNSVNI